MMTGRIQIAPSLLAADFGRVAEEVARVTAAGADMIHIDVMDGMFVPNISFGACVIKAARKATDLPLDVHMMVHQPERYIADMVEAGADIVTVHAEATAHIHRALQTIREHKNVRCGLALNPGTPVSAASCVAELLDLLLIMTVNPGFGGQKLIVPALDKIAEAKALLEAAGSAALLEVDGGVTADNARLFTEKGANVLVSGTAVFGAQDARAAMEKMREER